MTCEIQSAGTIDLYFYGELSPSEHARVQAHLRQCAYCREALDDLSTIRAALASRPDVATPPGGDWSGFMARLESHLDSLPGDGAPAPPARVMARVTRMPLRQWLPYVAAAAVLVLVTAGTLLVLRDRAASAPPQVADMAGAGALQREPDASASPDRGLVSLSGQHFERSKLVVLGLATKDAESAEEINWAYERELATSLLGDTRLYRRAAEERGMNTLAGVMRDLELVLLQTSMSESSDGESLGQLQRLIRRRDLITKMNVGYAGP